MDIREQLYLLGSLSDQGYTGLLTCVGARSETGSGNIAQTYVFHVYLYTSQNYSALSFMMELNLLKAPESHCIADRGVCVTGHTSHDPHIYILYRPQRVPVKGLCWVRGP